MGVGAGLGLRGHLIGGNVGRVGDDDVDHPVQVRERGWIRRVASLQVKAGNAHGVAVLTGQGEGLGFLFHGPYLRAGGLDGYCQPDRTGAGAQIDDSCLAAAGDDRHGLVNRKAGKYLGLRAHDEHTGSGGQGQATEEHATRDVLKGNAQGPLPHRRAQFLRLLLVQVLRKIPLGRGITRPLEQLTHVRIDRVDASVRQALASPRARLRHRPGSHSPSHHDCAAAARRSASSASCNEAMTASSEPDRTASRLCALKPVR